MIDDRTDVLNGHEESRVERPLGTADLVQRAEAKTVQSNGTQGVSERAALFPESELSGLRQQWQEAQTQFVDDPRSAVRRADELVASLMKRLAEVFATEREGLERDWDKGEEVSTEDLRQALRKYRSFFDRLLAV
ncbi:MAG: hypothetical protein ACJ746_20205 [Bryobacteraceae bacterium]